MTTTRPDCKPRPSLGFTLIELVVVLAIIAILSSLSFAGLAAVRQRAKADKTRSTIRKLHEIIVPQYESYLDRRVPIATLSGTAAARERTRQLRLLMAQEMPQSWAEVYPFGSIPAGAPASARAYAGFKASLSSTNASWPSQAHEGAECLAMIVMRGGFATEELEQFRSDEFGDVDNDGAVEFVDGWQQPIFFLRWPTGYRSGVQLQDSSVQPDPFDPMRVSDEVAYPDGVLQRDYALLPLIISQGADGPYSPVGIVADTTNWPAVLVSGTALGTLRVAGSGLAGETNDAAAAADNITNHDLMSR